MMLPWQLLIRVLGPWKEDAFKKLELKPLKTKILKSLIANVNVGIISDQSSCAGSVKNIMELVNGSFDVKATKELVASRRSARRFTRPPSCYSVATNSSSSLALRGCSTSELIASIAEDISKRRTIEYMTAGLDDDHFIDDLKKSRISLRWVGPDIWLVLLKKIKPVTGQLTPDLESVNSGKWDKSIWRFDSSRVENLLFHACMRGHGFNFIVGKEFKWLRERPKWK